MFWGNYQGTHYSALEADRHDQRAADSRRSGRRRFPATRSSKATPIVVDGIMYVTGSGNPLTVTALDAKTGRQIWRYTRQQPVKNPYENNRYNRGVGDPRQPAVRRHARRGAHRARRAQRRGAVAGADGRHDGGLRADEPAARRQGQGHHGHDAAASTRSAASSTPTTRRRGKRALALQHHARTRRVRQRHVEGRQLAEGRRRARG